MLKRVFVLTVLFLGLSLTAAVSMAGDCQSYYGSSSNCSYGNNNRGENSNASVLGFAGAIVGAAVFRDNRLAGAVLLGTPAYYVGRNMDRREQEVAVMQSERTAAVGRTDCNWRHSGYADANGVQHVTNSTFDCNGGNSTYGNRNVPPVPIGQ